MESEIWKDYPKMPEIIMVSNMGNIKTKTREVNSGNGTRIQDGRILSLNPDKNGYLLVNISSLGKRKTFRVHRLVLETFSPIDGYENLEVNHKDGMKTNNMLDNLEWVTHKENIQHAISTGLMPERIRKTYQYTCKRCNNDFESIEVNAVFCSAKCYYNDSRVVSNRPSKEELYSLLKDNSFSELSRVFGVSDNSIRKWCLSYGIPSNTKYYREKYRK